MQSERAARLAEVVAAMPDGPSRDRFLVILDEVQAADAARPPAGVEGPGQSLGDAADATTPTAELSSGVYDPTAADGEAAPVLGDEPLGLAHGAVGLDGPSRRAEPQSGAEVEAADELRENADAGVPSWADDPDLAGDTSAPGVEELFGASEVRGRVRVIPAEPDALPDKPKRRWGRRS